MFNSVHLAFNDFSVTFAITPFLLASDIYSIGLSVLTALFGMCVGIKSRCTGGAQLEPDTLLIPDAPLLKKN
jgi:hypothetical protein